jgi:hypothetical protein
MRNGIREFQPRQPLDRQLGATTLNQILRELESLRITRVVNGTFRKLPGGTEITVAPQRGGGTSTPTTHPFQIFSREDPESDPENPTYLVRVRPGTINALLPSDILDGGGLKENEIPRNSLRYVVLEANSDGQQITTATVSVESSAPEAQTPEIFGLPSTAKFLLGLVYDSNVFQVQFTNISVTGKQQFIASKDQPAEPGELPYEIYYVWG